MHDNAAVQQLAANVPSMFCAGIAGFLAYTGCDGWGWMIFLSIFMFVTLRRRSTEIKDGAQ